MTSQNNKVDTDSAEAPVKGVGCGALVSPPLVPYQPTPLGTRSKTRFLKETLSTGAEVIVALQETHPHTTEQVLRFDMRNTQPDGSRTALAFSLSLEAARAMMRMTEALGVTSANPAYQPRPLE